MEYKYKRNYRLRVQRTDDPLRFIDITLPFTIEIDVIRNNHASGSTTNIRIKNLSPSTRSQIRKNPAQYGGNPDKKIILEAGYGDDLSIIFVGNATRAWSVREGVDMVTTIQAFDVGLTPQLSQVSRQYPKGTKKRTVVLDLVKTLQAQGVEVGSIGNIEGEELRGASYSGCAIDLLRELTGGAFFIDNGKANVLGENEHIQGDALNINASTGLLNTPVLEGPITTVEILFEPKVAVSRRVILTSSTDQNFNGPYSIIAIKHKVTISESVSGPAVTTLDMLKEPKKSVSVKSGDFVQNPLTGSTA